MDDRHTSGRFRHVIIPVINNSSEPPIANFLIHREREFTMSSAQPLKTLIAFAQQFSDQASGEEKLAIEQCVRLAGQLDEHERLMVELKRRIDEHTLYLRSGWAIEKPVAPNNTYDLLREVSRAISETETEPEA